MVHASSLVTLTGIVQGHDELKDWCDNACLRRYLVARRMDVTKAEKMLQASIQWLARLHASATDSLVLLHRTTEGKKGFKAF